MLVCCRPCRKRLLGAQATQPSPVSVSTPLRQGLRGLTSQPPLPMPPHKTQQHAVKTLNRECRFAGGGPSPGGHRLMGGKWPRCRFLKTRLRFLRRGQVTAMAVTRRPHGAWLLAGDVVEGLGPRHNPFGAWPPCLAGRRMSGTALPMTTAVGGHSPGPPGVPKLVLWDIPRSRSWADHAVGRCPRRCRWSIQTIGLV